MHVKTTSVAGTAAGKTTFIISLTTTLANKRIAATGTFIALIFKYKYIEKLVSE